MDIILINTEGFSYLEASGFIGCVTAARRERIMKKSVDSDKLNALLGELLLISEISKRTGLPQKKIAFTKGPFGKPYLKSGRLWFSLSHTKGGIAAAFSDESEIGVDIERCDRKVNERLIERVLCEEEKRSMSGNKDFMRMWVQKEAFLKRLGVGISRDLRGANTLALPDTAAFEKDGFFLGASGAGAENAVISTLSPRELLKRFVKTN